MKIKNNTKSSNSAPILITIGIIALLSSFLLFNTDKSENKITSEITPDIELPTEIKLIDINYETLLTSDRFRLYDSEELSIHVVTKSGTTRLIYAYKEEPEGRALTDNFYAHVYVKDSTKLLGSATFVNADFYQTPESFEINDRTFYIYQRDLISKSYKGSNVLLDEIKYINTGRYKPKEGRSLDLRKLILDTIPKANLKNEFDKIHVIVKEKDFNKIKQKRDEALKIGVLSTGDNDLIDGEIAINDGEYQGVELRLKGDWPDHLRNEHKWSYRFIMKGDATSKGMRKFSVQHPKVRNYLWEWLFNKLVKDQDLIGLRYEFVDVDLNVIKGDSITKIPVGLMALEESFDKILIENNKKREGIILALDESLYWADTKKQRHLDLEHETYSKSIRSEKNAPIRVFNKNKVLSDPKLAKQFSTAKDLIEGLRLGKYKISEVFDIDKLSTYVALSNLFGAYHGLVWHNLRIYYNPITGKLEPVSYDSNSGIQLNKITHYPFHSDDPIYHQKVLEKLKLVSSSDFINSFVKKYQNEIASLNNELYLEFSLAKFDASILEYNSNFIKKIIHPAEQVVANLISYDSERITLEVNNVADLPVTITGIMHTDGRKLNIRQDIASLNAGEKKNITFDLNKYFRNAFVSKKNKKGGFEYPKDVEKLQLSHFIPGVDHLLRTPILPYGTNQDLDASIALHRSLFNENYKDFPFIEVTSDSMLLFKEGSYTLNRDLVIPPGKKTTVSPGFELDFTENASLRSSSALIAQGSKEKSIRFFSSDSTGGGLFITDAKQQSQLDYCIFDNLSNPQNEMWSVSGAVNFHESDVTISNTTFKNNRCEDGLNIIRSQFTMTDTIFEGTQSDSFDGDFVTGTLERCTFVNSGNDGIDVSGSSLILKDITVLNPSDKGISAGENSAIQGESISITGGEIGVVSKDLSIVNLSDVRIIGTRLGLSAFQKKTEYGVASISINALFLKDNELDYLIENKSSLLVDNIAVETVSDNVIDQMYGNEYGKSSR